MIESITGGNTEVVSFVSEKNTNVDEVQFVIQTEAIEIEISPSFAVLLTKVKIYIILTISLKMVKKGRWTICRSVIPSRRRRISEHV